MSADKPKPSWTFTEAQRPAVCRGHLCPTTKCKQEDITCLGIVWDGMNPNAQFRCKCGEEWEGY